MTSGLIVEHLLREDVDADLTQARQPHPLCVPPFFSDQPTVPGQYFGG
jgi:hypothetical protein